jgi:hypothetical protein
MPDTGDRREIKRFVNAKEAETVQEANKAASTAEQQSAKAARENQARKQRNGPGHPKAGKVAESQSDKAASDKMVDEGDPNPQP